MCEDCGCGDPELVSVDVRRDLLSANDALAAENRSLLRASRTLAVNVMGAPGSGKTAVLEATARARVGRWRIGALAGDLATDNDARRLDAAGIESRAIATGSACHLDAAMVRDALAELSPESLDVLFVENVGNLVCPAVYDLGQDLNVVALSVTEGEDKPLKYPVIFREADLVLLTKTDLLLHIDVDVAAIRQNLARVMPEPRLVALSAATGRGVSEWVAWLEAQRHRDSAA